MIAQKTCQVIRLCQTKLAQDALVIEEGAEIEQLIAMIRRLAAVDTKCVRLREALASLRADGYQQAMVFTQFTDTMDFLRAELRREGDLRIMCFSGRGGEVANNDDTWRVISRDDVKRRFREGAADVLLCTDAAAEGLNFQFCGALINYDMPWNPMRVEQRIGRIDRLGQAYPDIRIVNMHYADTVETDVYVALRHRIGLFERVVGGLGADAGGATMPTVPGAAPAPAAGAATPAPRTRSGGAKGAPQATGLTFGRARLAAASPHRRLGQTLAGRKSSWRSPW